MGFNKHTLSSPLLVLGTHNSVLLIRFTLSLSAYQNQTISQHRLPAFSLKMVIANIIKELQNVLPKCSPIDLYIEYTTYRGIRIAPLAV